MNFPSRLQPETSTRPKAQSTGAIAPEMKPRKVNSEVRKQQNRIASRNYREKRKRKLQQLQQLLEDDDSGELQTYTRLTSPYEDRSCSRSVRYERSVTSSSPHIVTVPGNLQSPQPDHTTIANQTWATPAKASTKQPFTSATYQQASVYGTSTPGTARDPVWSMMPSAVSTGYSTPGPTHQTMYPSYSSLWPSPEFRNSYPDVVLQQWVVPSTASYTPSWQHHTNEDFPAGIALGP